MAGSSSGVGFWNQNPVGDTAVTTPSTPLTGFPTSGEMWLAPWICGIVSGSSGVGGTGVHGSGPAAELRGEGSPTEKSAALLSVSVQGLVRLADVAFVVP